MKVETGVPREKNLPRRIWNRQTKFIYNHWLAALVKGKFSSTKPTRLVTGVVCHPDTEQNRPYKIPWSCRQFEPGTTVPHARTLPVCHTTPQIRLCLLTVFQPCSTQQSASFTRHSRVHFLTQCVKECVHDFQVILYMSILYNASHPTCFIQITLVNLWTQFNWKSNRLYCYLFLSIVLEHFSTQQLTPFRAIQIQDIFDHTFCCWNVLRLR